MRYLIVLAIVAFTLYSSRLYLRGIILHYFGKKKVVTEIIKTQVFEPVGIKRTFEITLEITDLQGDIKIELAKTNRKGKIE